MYIFYLFDFCIERHFKDAPFEKYDLKGKIIKVFRHVILTQTDKTKWKWFHKESKKVFQHSMNKYTTLNILNNNNKEKKTFENNISLKQEKTIIYK